MFSKMSHGGSESFDEEIQFRTPFGYMFPPLVAGAPGSNPALLPESSDTTDALLALGDAMADPGNQTRPHPEMDSKLPAVMTYIGQFVDHDITANTDRDGEMFNAIAAGSDLTPVAVADVTGPDARLTNGRRPHLDLDSVYGDGPPLVAESEGTLASELYDDELLLKVQRGHGYLDLPRGGANGRDARIADLRNDENIIVGQFHAMMLLFHNRVAEALSANNADGPSHAHRYLRARQLVRWCYQYVVAHEYLPAVCDKAVVEDVLRNGPRHFAPGIHAEPLFMPLEFSVAAFRFAHSMIRPFYQLNAKTELSLIDVLGPAHASQDPAKEALQEHGGAFRLKPDRVVEWGHFVPRLHGAHQNARRIDPRLATGLFQLDEGLGERMDANLKHLARSNLLRAYKLRIPTGQAVAKAMGIVPLAAEQMAENDGIGTAVRDGGFDTRTPLWYYVLREAEVQQKGNRLGAVGSRIVAETLMGLLKNDPNSFLNNRHDPNISDRGIELWTDRHDRTRIATIADMVEFAGAPV
mgnify:CR=1 FL=1